MASSELRDIYEVYNREVRKLRLGLGLGLGLVGVCPDGCSSVGKVAQWRPGGHGFNPYIPQWHLAN